MRAAPVFLPAALALATAAAAPEAAPSAVAALERGRLVESQHCRSDPTQTYTFYLPKAYTPARRWPILLVMDPRGRSVVGAERFVGAAEELGWVLVSSNDTRSDGPPGPNARALQALWPEMHSRFAVDEGRIYFAGFSGTGILALEVARRSGQIAGVIASSARWEGEHSDEKVEFPCFGAAGDTDFNYAPMVSLHERLRKWGTPERLEIFEGSHQWMPVEVARDAMDWMEVEAMKAGRRPRDEGLVSRLLERDLAGAAALESAGRPLEARRRYEAVAATFRGLADVSRAEREAARLQALPATMRALKIERRWDGYEEATVRRHQDAYRELMTAELPLFLERFREAFGVRELRAHAAAAGYEGTVGRRLLNTLATRTGFYLARDLRKRGEYARAAIALAIAAEARPDRAWLWYDLACARARSGDRGGALDALEEAVARGYADRDHMAADEDLETLRGERRFQALLAGKVPPAPSSR
jgi:predicted esterase